ncbi:hypothetical protein HYW76_01685 [Candidatus Pacearchaeota archaeon]|nr:hypothetical protein [Candidatus Pacearchaeota archaeon]
MKLKIITLVLALILVSSAPVFGITAALGNARMVLYPEVGTTLYKTILVKNMNDVSVNITLTVDEEIREVVEAIDNEFILLPGEERNAQIKINARKAGDYSGKVRVFFKADKGAGVGLASEIIIRAGSGVPNNSQNDSSDITGDNIITSDDEKSSNITIFAIISTIVLFVLLLVLITLKKNKEGKINRLKELKEVDE